MSALTKLDSSGEDKVSKSTVTFTTVESVK